MVKCGPKGQRKAVDEAYDVLLNFLAANGVIDEPFDYPANPQVFRVFGKIDYPVDVTEFHGCNFKLIREVLHGASDALLELDAEAARELAAERRERGDPLVDNPWQQPGEFVVDADGTLQLTYRYQYCEDYPEPSVLLTALRQASG